MMKKNLNFHISKYSKPNQLMGVKVLAKILNWKNSNLQKVDRVNNNTKNVVHKVDDQHIHQILDER